MIDFTFLTEDQCFSVTNKLEIFKKRGNKAAVTDFAIIFGSTINDYSKKEYEKDKYNALASRTGKYLLKTFASTTKNEQFVYSVSENGKKDLCKTTFRSVSARPVIPYLSISDLPLKTKLANDNILEVEYGEYPQMAVSKELQKELELAFGSGSSNLKKTGKCYKIDLVDYLNVTDKFKPGFIEEYIYNDKKKYIRIDLSTRTHLPTEHFSNDEHYYNGSIVWIEVSPIKWLIDKKSDLAVSEKLLFSGIQFNNQIDPTCDFEKSDIKKYMDNDFSKDIIPSKVKEDIIDIQYEMENDNLNEKSRNPYNFNLSKVSEEEIIKGAIESGVAVFLHGPSSEGKSARVKEIDPTCEIIYLANASVDSLIGKSVYNQSTGEMIDVKPSWLKKLESKCKNEPDRLHILFLDEITHALPSVQGLAFNIVLDREVNGIWKLPENARIVAAGNEVKDSMAANQIAEPLFNRFAHVYIETTVDKWLKWASEHNIHPAIFSYIAYKKELALRSRYDGEKPNADPRKWEMASKMLYATGKPEMLRALVGEDITKDFINFCSKKVITLDDVLNDNYKEEDLIMNTSEIYATALGLSQVDEKNYLKIRDFVLKLGAEPCAMFDLLWTHGDEKRWEIVQEARLAHNIESRR